MPPIVIVPKPKPSPTVGLGDALAARRSKMPHTRPVSATTPRYVDGTTVGYWSWYYPCSDPTGSNNLEPITGAFWGDHFYRVTSTLFDVHKLVGSQPPALIFSDGFESGDPSAWSAVVP